jgi:beta-galactosidase
MHSVAQTGRALAFAFVVLTFGGQSMADAQQGADVQLPAGVKAVWEVQKASREATPTRERICINGLWRFKPAATYTEGVPAAGTGWGYFRVPGPWPGKGGDGQTLYAPASWNVNLGGLDAVWYARDIAVPADWQGRRVALHVDNLNSYATVFIDGTEAGSMVFPGGDLDLTAACAPGKKYSLAIRVIAQGLNAEGTDYVSHEPRANNWTRLTMRGLCGDVFLTSAPSAARITDAKVDTSVRRWLLTVDAGLADLQPGKTYTLRATVRDSDGKEALTAEGAPFTAADLKNGRISFDKTWKTPKLWDTDTPQNMYHLSLDLMQGGSTLDAYYPVRFGFREFWIDGRDFILNGSPVHLRALPLNSAVRGPIATTAAYEGARETLERIQSFGFNCVYGHNYDCSPGSHVSYADILRAADDTGMLFCFSLPHMNDFDWKGHDKKTNGYERDLEWYVRRAENHPSVVMYAQNHNFLFVRDMDNPELLPLNMDKDPIVAEARTDVIYGRERILRQFDTTRPVYNHGGWSRELFTMNCYLNWVPMQERAEWVQLWSEKGVRPLFMVEYGEPYFASFLAVRSFDDNVVHQLYLPEWGSSIRGDEAFKLSDFEKNALRFEAQQWQQNKAFPTWAYPDEMAKATNIANLTGIQGAFVAHVWPYFRAFGLSGFNIWSEWNFSYPRPGLSVRQDFKVDWDGLQKAGISADSFDAPLPNGFFYSLSTKRSDWTANTRGEALLRYNRPLLAFIGGPASRITAQDHNMLPGETVEKQIVVINDSRRAVDCDCRWSFGLPEKVEGQRTVHVEAGRQARIPVQPPIPASTAAGTYALTMKASFSSGEVQEDLFPVDVMAPAPKPEIRGRVALYDPKGQTAGLLSGMGVRFDALQADSDLAGYAMLVVGKGALTADGPAPDLARVRDGLKVVVFEQTSEALEQRLGFRVEEFGERRAFRRVADAPVLAGLSNEALRDWRGSATLVPPTLPLPKLNTYQMVKWCGFDERRPPRCGNYGNVSSVMIQKPTAGDFLPLLECGFGLDYSPLMLYREGKGMVLFCQVDVTGRTQEDPAAARLAANVMEYADSYSRPAPAHSVLYAGEPAGLRQLKAAGVAAADYEGQPLGKDGVLVVAPSTGDALSAHAADVKRWVGEGGRLLAVGLSEAEAQPLLPFAVKMQTAEQVSTYFEPQKAGTLLAGVGCGDVLVRAPRQQPLVVGGAEALGDGVLAEAKGACVAFLQLVPWSYDYGKLYNTKTTFQNSSFVLNRLLGNLGAAFETPLLSRFAHAPGAESKPWLDGLYQDKPVAEDDHYRYFCW